MLQILTLSLTGHAIPHQSEISDAVSQKYRLIFESVSLPWKLTMLFSNVYKLDGNASLHSLSTSATMRSTEELFCQGKEVLLVMLTLQVFQQISLTQQLQTTLKARGCSDSN